MLEMKEDLEKEKCRKGSFDYDIIGKYECKVLIARFEIKKYGAKRFLGEDGTLEKEKGMMFCNLPVEERKELYYFLKKKSHLSDRQLGKEMFRESEYYWGF